MKHYLAGLPLCLLLALAGCSTETPGPEKIGPEPFPLAKFVGRDSIVAGDYRGIRISASPDDAFGVLEQYRQQNLVRYIGAVNNYFSDVTDLKAKIPHFNELVLDEESDTETGVQVQLASGIVKSIALNNRRQLTQWPETATAAEAIQKGDGNDILCEKLVALSKRPEYAVKFKKMVLLARYTYAIYDPVKAAFPWSFVYSETPGQYENVQVFFKDKKVQYVVVSRFAE